MPNSSNNKSNILLEQYCQGNNRPEWCTKTSNSNTSNNIGNQLNAQKVRHVRVNQKIRNAENQVRKATNSLASVNRPETPKTPEYKMRIENINKYIAAHKGNLREAEAALEKAKALKEKATVISDQSAASAAGGARKSRKHKRTRKHMRKHTRKHKVMKSKMTKSKSKKVMQKGGTRRTRYTTPEEGIKNDLERLKERKVATREIELAKLSKLKSATHGIEKMKKKGY